MQKLNPPLIMFALRDAVAATAFAVAKVQIPSSAALPALPAKMTGRSVAALLLLLACSSTGYSGSAGGNSQRTIASPDGGQSALASPAQNATAALLQASAPAGPGAVTLNAIPLGAITSTGAGHYNPLPIITAGGTRTFLAVAKGSRVQAYVDGQPGPVVNAIPVTQTLTQVGGRTDGSPQFSADQKRVAYIVGLDNNKQAVVVDGTMSPSYDYAGWLSFAPAGHHFAYMVQDAQRQASFVVDDGKAGLIYQSVAPGVFSPDGRHFAYIAYATSHGLTPVEVQAGKTQPQNVCVVLDGVEQKHFAKIEQPLIFSQDSNHLAYLAGIDQLHGGTRVVIDGQEGPAYVGVRDLVMSDDGSRSAYIATKLFSKKVTQNGITSDASYQYDVVVENGKEGPADDWATQIQHLSISRDGRRVAYAVVGQTQGHFNTVIVDNGKPSQQYSSCQSVQISPDGKTVLYIVGDVIVANGREYGPFSGTFAPAFSQEGGHWACGVSLASGGFAIIEDGKTIGVKGVAPETLAFQPGTNQLMMKSPNSHDGIAVMFEVKGAVASVADVPTDSVYSPNQQHVAKVFTSDFQTSQQKQKIVIDDQPPMSASYAGISAVAVSDDGRHVAVIDGTHVVYDGVEGPVYFRVKDLALSPDGKHVAYVAEKTNPHGIDTYVVVDGMEGPAFQDALIDGAFTGLGMGAYKDYHQVRFAPDGSLHFFPVVNGQLYRCWYAAAAFKGLPSLAAHEAEKPGPRDVHNFKNPDIFQDRAEVMSFVLAPDETIYGVSDADGKFKHGTLFKLKTDGSGFTVLHNFYGGDNDGQNPTSLLLLPDGSLFGAAGKAFRYDPKSQQFAIVKLDQSADVPNMLAGTAADGTIIGVSGGFAILWAGQNIVSMAPDGSNYVSFGNTQFAKPPRMYSRIIAGKDGTFFAVSTNNGGSLVKFKSLKDTPALVHKFVDGPDDGTRPDVNLVLDKQGNLYGSTAAGGMSQHGVIYKINADGSNYTVVYNPDEFTFSRVFVPGDDGMLYGISEKGGLLQLNPDGTGKPPATLVAFDWDKIGNNRGNVRGMPDVTFHNGAVYARDSAAIYKVTLPKEGAGGGASFTPTVTINTAQPAPLSFETITFTAPTGTATAGAAVAAQPANALTQSTNSAPQQSSQSSPKPSQPPVQQNQTATAANVPQPSGGGIAGKAMSWLGSLGSSTPAPTPAATSTTVTGAVVDTVATDVKSATGNVASKAAAWLSGLGSSTPSTSTEPAPADSTTTTVVKTAAAVVADPAAAATDAANKAAQTKADKLASKAKSWLDKLTTTKSKP